MAEDPLPTAKPQCVVSLTTMADQWLEGGSTHDAAVTYTKAYALDPRYTRVHFCTLPQHALQAVVCTFEDWCMCGENSNNLLLQFDIPISLEQLCDFVTSPEVGPESKVAWSLKVKLLIKRKNYVDATTACTEAMQQFSALDVFLLVSRGLAFLLLHETDKAIKDYLSAYDLNPSSTTSCIHESQNEHIDKILQSFYQLVTQLERRANVTEEEHGFLVKLYKFILQFTEKDAMAYESCAGHLSKLGNVKEAVTLLSDGLLHMSALGDKPGVESLQLLMKRAECYLTTEEHDLALNDYAAAASIDEDITRAAMFSLGHQQQGRICTLAKQLASDLLSHCRIKSKLKVPCSVDTQISRNQLTRAANLYRLLYLTDNSNIEALIRSAECLKLQGEETEAIRIYTLALSLRPKSPKTHTARAACHMDSGNIQNALSDFNKALELQPENVEALCGRGCTWLVCGKLTNAVSDFARASLHSCGACVKWAQELSETRLEILKTQLKGYLTSTLKKAEKMSNETALCIGDLLTRVFPEDLECHLAYVDVLMALKKADEATAVLVRLLRNSPENHLHSVHLAALKLRQGKAASSLDDLRTILRTVGEKRLSEMLLQLSEGERSRINKEAELEGEQLLRAGASHQEVVACYSVAVAASPNTASGAYLKRAICHANKGQNKLALAGFSSVLKVEPNSVEAYCRRGLVHASCSNLRDSYRDFLKALVLDIKAMEVFVKSLSNSQRPLALGSLEDCAQILFSQYISHGNKSDHMLSLCSLLVRSDPQVASYHSMYADGLIIQEDYCGAIRELEAAGKLCPDDMSVLGRSGLVHMKLDNIELASAEFSRMAETDPEGLSFMLQALNASQKTVLHQEATSRAEHLSRTNQYEKALSFYNVVVAATEGKDQDTLRMRSRCYERLQRFGRAVDDLSAVISIGRPLIGDICARANLHILDDNLRCACQDFVLAFEMNETVALNFISSRPGKEALVKIFNKASIEAYESRNYFEAVKSCNYGLKLDPNNYDMKRMKMKIDFGVAKCSIQ